MSFASITDTARSVSSLDARRRERGGRGLLSRSMQLAEYSSSVSAFGVHPSESVLTESMEALLSLPRASELGVRVSMMGRATPKQLLSRAGLRQAAIGEEESAEEIVIERLNPLPLPLPTSPSTSAAVPVAPTEQTTTGNAEAGADPLGDDPAMNNNNSAAIPDLSEKGDDGAEKVDTPTGDAKADEHDGRMLATPEVKSSLRYVKKVFGGISRTASKVFPMTKTTTARQGGGALDTELLPSDNSGGVHRRSALEDIPEEDAAGAESDPKATHFQLPNDKQRRFSLLDWQNRRFSIETSDDDDSSKLKLINGMAAVIESFNGGLYC